MVFAVVVLAAGLLVCAARLFLLKQDLKRMHAQLLDLQSAETNAHITTATRDADMCALAAAFNVLLARHKAQTLEYRGAQAGMKQALTNISHDLRTPLTSALGYMQLMEAPQTNADQRREYAAIIQARIKALSSLTDHLFEFTRILERPDLKTEKMNVCNTLRDVLAGYYDDFTQRGFEVRLDIPEAPLYVIAQEEAVKRVFQNLIQNALVHGTQSFAVEIHGTAREIVFRNRVENSSGIDLEHIFDRFYTFDAARTHKHTGLGLAIVKNLVEAMGAQISAQLDEQTLSFTITLP